MKKIALTFILLASLLIGVFAQGLIETKLSDLGALWSLRRTVRVIDTVILQNAQNTTGVYTRTTLDTLETKTSLYDYVINIGSTNDTIVLIDPLDWNQYNGDTTSVINIIKWWNSDDNSQLYLKYNDSILSYNTGVVDLTKANNITFVRDANSGTFIDQCVRINTVTSAKPVVPSAPSAPDLLGGAVAAENTYIDVYTDKDVYGLNDGSTPVSLSDFTVIFAQSGGTATDWVADSITTNDTVAIASGEDTIRIWGTISGTADGNETLTVTPANSSSIYQVNGITMVAGATTGAINLTGATDAIPSDYVAYYTFTGDASDETGNYDGVNYGASLTNDRFSTANSAYSFTASESDSIGLSNSGLISEVSTHNQGSISFWYNMPDVTPSSAQTLISFAKSDENTLFYIFITTTGAIRFRIASLGVTQFTYEFTPSVLNDTWYNITITQNSSGFIFYFGGTPLAGNPILSDNIGAWLDDIVIDNIIIGTLNVNSIGFGSNYDGVFDDLLIYDRVLTPTEITNISNNR